jgi:hypothetical protein
MHGEVKRSKDSDASEGDGARVRTGYLVERYCMRVAQSSSTSPVKSIPELATSRVARQTPTPCGAVSPATRCLYRELLLRTFYCRRPLFYMHEPRGRSLRWRQAF